MSQTSHPASSIDLTAIAIEERNERSEARFFAQRWSPRAMSGEAISGDDLIPLFEAARWAPSSFNQQPWRFLWASHSDVAWATFFGLLNEFNQSWCKDAGALLVIISRNRGEDGRAWKTHAFDAGAAWQNFALQGLARNLVVHAMAGFDPDAAREQLRIPEEYSVHAMIAVGHPADPDVLPPDLRDRETPSGRKSVGEIAFRGAFSSEKDSSD